MSYATPMGFTTKRPRNYPAIDRSALMRDAHQIAKASRALAAQAGQPAAPFTAAQIEASRSAGRRCGASLWAS
jgi:hypothetical protein